ncbi:hypothetical protein DFR69_10898 [Nocardia neocaledoniensis]|uniref:Uncharacterized protein n=2 Tax=Nocardia neocaledoniensis TaxID=236511 RepID=A0A317NBT9_9NOCA|nr:LPO_1073/Vpar_1526 family protein [Nocardia neocaledoniensis]PWV72786.1 hypothetical protein DFR69_10898 [Nocardia neocaledoniensis]
MRTEFEKFSTAARVVVEERAQEFLYNYMSRQAQVAPESAISMEQPRMQRALQSAQIEYATSGEADLGSVLVDLVVDLSQQDGQSVYATSITEAISIAPKLTTAQMNALAIVTTLRLRTWGWSTLQDMYDGLRRLVVPFIGELPDGGLDYRHMQGVGVSWMGAGTRASLPGLLLDMYPGMFTLGTLPGEVPSVVQSIEGAVVDALRDPDRKQLSVIATANLSRVFEQNNFSTEVEDVLKQFQRSNLFDAARAELDITSRIPEIKKLISVWDDTNLKDVEVSSAGLVIADAHLRSKVEDVPALGF